MEEFVCSKMFFEIFAMFVNKFLRFFSLYFIRLVSQQNQEVIRFQTAFVLTQSSVTSVIIQRISVLSLFSNGKLI